MAVKIHKLGRGVGRPKKEEALWSYERFLEIRTATKAELDALKQGSEPKEVAEQLRTFFTDALNNPEEDQQMRAYVVGMTLLVFHDRHKILKPVEVSGIEKAMFDLLLVNRITPNVRRLSFLYGDLFQVTSMIHRYTGRSFKAAWDQGRAERLTRDSNQHQHGHLQYGSALRNLRLGNRQLVELEIREILNNPHLQEYRSKALMLYAKLARLCGDQELFSRNCHELEQIVDLPAGIKAELAWERQCWKVRTGEQTAAQLLLLTKPSRTFDDTEFLLESYLWTMASPEKKLLAKLASYKTLSSRQSFNGKAHTALAKAVRVLLECYDTEIPLEIRLGRLGKLLEEAHEMVAIDQELLLWAAASRLLIRVKADRLGRIALAQYSGLSLRVSDGATHDSLGVIADLLSSHILPQKMAS